MNTEKWIAGITMILALVLPTLETLYSIGARL